MVDSVNALPSNAWDAAFGQGSGTTIEERARNSRRTFVRSMDQLAFDSGNASGQRLTAYEVLRNFGSEKIAEILEHGTAVLVSDPLGPSTQPGARIRQRRIDLGLSKRELANRVNLSEDDLTILEQGASRVPASALARICSALSLDEYAIGLEDPSEHARDLGVRFRRLKTDSDRQGFRLDNSSMLSLLEDAWIIDKQNELHSALSQKSEVSHQISPSPDYGNRGTPAWKIGYELAAKTRRILGLGPIEPIENLRILLESRLQIPLIQDELNKRIAGATLQYGDARGIVLNISGRVYNAWSARLTIAHELGHLLWDPDSRLNSLIVDTGDDLDEAPWAANLAVEQRANAFAIEFLFPRAAVEQRLKGQREPPDDILEFMIEFGVSFTAARYHIWNATYRQWELTNLKASAVEPTDDWEAREQFLTTFLPSRELEEGLSMNRRGNFLAAVMDAHSQRLISDDTAALYLGVENHLLKDAREVRKDFFD